MLESKAEPDERVVDASVEGALFYIAEEASRETESLRGRLIETEAMLRLHEEENVKLKALLDIAEARRTEAEVGGRRDLLTAHAKEIEAAVQQVKAQSLERERDRLEAGVSTIVSVFGQAFPERSSLPLPSQSLLSQEDDTYTDAHPSTVNAKRRLTFVPPSHNVDEDQASLRKPEDQVPTSPETERQVLFDTARDTLAAAEAVNAALLARAEQSEKRLQAISYHAHLAMAVQRAESVARDAALTAQLSSLCAVVAANETRRVFIEEETAQKAQQSEHDLLAKLRDAEDALRVLAHTDFGFESMARDTSLKLAAMEEKVATAQRQLRRLPQMIAKRVQSAEARANASEQCIRLLGHNYATLLEHRHQAPQLMTSSTHSTPLRRALPDASSSSVPRSESYLPSSSAARKTKSRESLLVASNHSNGSSRTSPLSTPPRFRF